MNHKHSAIAIFAFFAVMALLTPYSQSHGWGLSGLFFAMITACLVVVGGGWVLRKMRDRARLNHLSREDTARFLIGAAPRPYYPDEDDSDFDPYVRQGEIVDDMPPLSSLVPYDQVYGYGELDGQADDDLPDTIIEPHGLDLGPRYQPSAESFAGQTVLACGTRGSGKSNGVMVLAEELGRFQMPLCIADTEDENQPLANRRYLSRGVLAGSAELLDELGHLPNFVALDLEGAYEFGKSIMRDALQVVLNLKSFDENTAAMVMAEIIDGMNDWANDQPSHLRVPCMFFLDEANKWLPQQVAESCVTDKEALYLLQNAIFGTMVRRGRKRGFGIVLATQRIAELDKRALQSSWKFLFRQTEEVDIARYVAHGIDKADVPGLRNGECFVFSPSVIGFRFQFRKRHSPHLSHTPGFSQLAQHMRQVNHIDQVLHRYQSNDQGEYTTGERERVEQQADAGSARRPRALPQLLQKALDTWYQGISYRELGDAIGVGKDKAGELIKELERRRLIPVKEELE